MFSQSQPEAGSVRAPAYASSRFSSDIAGRDDRPPPIQGSDSRLFSHSAYQQIPAGYPPQPTQAYATNTSDRGLDPTQQQAQAATTLRHQAPVTTSRKPPPVAIERLRRPDREKPPAKKRQKATPATTETPSTLSFSASFSQTLPEVESLRVPTGAQPRHASGITYSYQQPTYAMTSQTRPSYPQETAQGYQAANQTQSSYLQEQHPRREPVYDYAAFQQQAGTSGQISTRNPPPSRTETPRSSGNRSETTRSSGDTSQATRSSGHSRRRSWFSSRGPAEYPDYGWIPISPRSPSRPPSQSPPQSPRR